MNSYLNYNGKLIKSGKAIIRADNRGFKYGDGLFETMIVLNNQIRLALYHFERLFEGLRLLEFERPDFFTAEFFKEQILSLCERNSHERKARVRLMIFRGKVVYITRKTFFLTMLLKHGNCRHLIPTSIRLA